MAMVACGECQTRISSDATVCPRCGKPQPGDSHFRCDDCYVPNHHNAQNCRNCGASLGPVREREAKFKQDYDLHNKAWWGGAVCALVGAIVVIGITSGSGKSSCVEFVLVGLGMAAGYFVGYHGTHFLLSPTEKKDS